MRYSILAFLYSAQLALAGSSGAASTTDTDCATTTTCAHDNCLRAVIASAFSTRSGTADCQSYLRTTVVTNTAVQTIVPSLIPSYASACSGSVRYSSACECVGAVPATTTASGYVIVSPTSCPYPNPTPTGTPIGQSDPTFSSTYGGLNYTQYPNGQFILQNATSEIYYLDLSDPTRLVISDTKGDTLIIYANGTYFAYAGNCELEFVGTLPPPPGKQRRNDQLSLASRNLHARGLDCSAIQPFCQSAGGVAAASFAAGFACASIGAELGSDIGGGIGFLGNLLGPEVGIPTTIAGVYLGGALGGFVASRFGQSLCAAGTGALLYEMCDACPECPAGTITCSVGAKCQDALSDPSNCGACGNVCPSGFCVSGTCKQPYYDDNGADDLAQ